MEKSIKPYSPFQEWIGTKLIKAYGSYQVWLYEISGGRLANRFLGSPCAILTTTGRKSGKKRKTPLLFIEDGSSVVVAGTKGGMSTAPLWYKNILANPQVEIQIGNNRRAMLARTATVDETPSLWPKMDAMYDGFPEYRQRLKGVREAPLIILEEICSNG